MSFDFLDRRGAERFAELLDSTSGGRRYHSRGQADDQLAELVAIGHSLSAARTSVQVDSEFRVGLRAMLVATAERDGIGAAETEPEPAAVPVGEPVRGLFGRGAGRRIRARGAIVIGVAAGALAVSGISAASDSASPGDALYGVKRSTEKAQLAMAGSDVTRGQLSLDFARTRLAEAVAMRGDDPEFTRVLDDMDADTRQGVRLLNASAVARRDTRPLDTVDGFVALQRRTLEPVLGDLGAGNQARAMQSLTLLDNADSRADTLRAGLACEPVTAAGTDSLGPRLDGCPTGTGTDDADDTPVPQRPQGSGPTAGTRPGPVPSESQRVRPLRSGPAGAPAATGPATAPATAGADTGSAPDRQEPSGADVTPTATSDVTPPAPATTAPATPDEDADEGLLDGILDGILTG